MKPSKILIVGNYRPDRQESMQRFADLMVRELQSAEYNVKLLQPSPKFNTSSVSTHGVSKWLGYIDKYLVFPFVLKSEAKWADVVHICDHSNAPYVKHLSRKPHLVTCHDVMAISSALGDVPQNKTGVTGKFLQRFILSGLNKAQRIVCVSNQTRSELLTVSKLGEETATVIYNCLNYNYSVMNFAEAQTIVGSLLEAKMGRKLDQIPPFIFHIGGNQWYKNRMGVLRIFDQICNSGTDKSELILVMAGKNFTAEMRNEIAVRKLTDRVIELNDCSNEEVRALYSLAQLLLFPSLAEGFGWPIVEALACGCRVVTTNAAPMTEIGGNAAIYCDPQNETEAANIVNGVLHEDEQKRQTRISTGLEQAKLFSSNKMISSYVREYSQIFQEKG